MDNHTPEAPPEPAPALAPLPLRPLADLGLALDTALVCDIDGNCEVVAEEDEVAERE